MHIAIDARIINSSTGRYIERLLTHLEELDSPHRYTVLVREKDKDYWKPKTKKFTVVVAEFADYSFAEQIGFYTFLQKLNADLVHFCMPQQPLLYRGKAVTTVHDLNLLRIKENDDMSPTVLKIKQFIFARLLRKVIKKSRYIITPTEYTKNDLLNFKRVPNDKVVVTYEAVGVAVKKLQVVQKLKNEAFILYVGRAEAYKNNRRLIKAHQQLLKERPNLLLVIAGKIDTLRQKDVTWVTENGYTNVIFPGFMSDEELAWLYTNCKAYVFPSFMEGFGLPPLEAMLYGAPVASSDTTCLPEVLGDAAVYFDPSGVDEMAEAIKSLLENKELRDTIISAGKNQVKKYSWTRMAEQTLDVYNKALDS